jgi:trehalose/maltose transport system substrate-binding protein
MRLPERLLQRLGASLLGAGLLLAGLLRPAVAVELAIACGALGLERNLCAQGVAAWSHSTGHRVRLVSTPNSSTERLALYLQMLAAGTDDIDVLQIDVVWPGILHRHLLDLKPYLGDAPAAHFPILIANSTLDGRLVAMPWWTDAGVLYYRTDLLERYRLPPPTTWAELERTAKTILVAEHAAGNTSLQGFVWQGRAYEGLTCNALEWIDSFGGGTLVAADGRVTVNNPQAIEALRTAASWVGGISPPGVLNYDEEAARGVFQSGNAIFMRNWPYAWALAQGADSPVRGKVGVGALPRGGAAGKTSGTLGGWQLAVSRYSRHPAEAADLVRFLTSAAQQSQRAIRAAYNPTLPALYDDPEVLAANPFFGQLRHTFEHAVVRPSRVTGSRYNRVSSAFWQAVHDVLAGQADATPRLARLEGQLNHIGRRGHW